MIKKAILGILTTFLLLFVSNVTFAGNGVPEQKKTKLTISSTANLVFPVCRAGTITQTRCPDGTLWTTGFILVFFNCETGQIINIITENYSNLPGVCEGHEGDGGVGIG